MPGSGGDKENPVYDRGNRNQVERDGRCKRGADKSKIDGFRTPHWCQGQLNVLRQKRRLDTKKIVKNHVDRRDHENDLGRDRKETLRLEISTIKTVRVFPKLGHRAYRDMALKAYAGRPMEAYLRYIAAR